jgi:asparagine synthase (glutamine-hydrolysing)
MNASQVRSRIQEFSKTRKRVDSLKRAGVFIPDQVVRLTGKCRCVKGLKRSNSDNMRMVAILSTMFVHHHYIIHDGRGKSDEMPAGPVTVIDRLL